jgi:hypothetical protein
LGHHCWKKREGKIQIRPEVSLEHLAESIQIRCYQEVLGIFLQRWMENYQKTLRYKEERGDCNVPERKDPELHRWQTHQRTLYKRGSLEDWQIKLLNEIGFSRDIDHDIWVSFVEDLIAWRTQTGGWVIPQNSTFGRRVARLRDLNRKGRLPKAVEDRRHKVDSIAFPWNPKDLLEERFVQTVKELEAHFRKNGNYRISDPKLKTFADRQRHLRKEGKLNNNHETMLDTINFPWYPQTERWEQYFEAWQEAVRTGTKLTGSLRSWVSNQITELGDAEKRNNNPLFAERYKRLVEAKFPFGLKKAQEDALWDEMLMNFAWSKILDKKAAKGSTPGSAFSDRNIGTALCANLEKDASKPEISILVRVPNSLPL